MDIDWKDALSSLKESGKIPADTSPDPVEERTESSIPKPSLKVIVDRKGRKGKTATIIEGFGEDSEELLSVAKTLKQKLGAGGSARGGEILIQGDRREEVIRLLSGLGYKAK